MPTIPIEFGVRPSSLTDIRLELYGGWSPTEGPCFGVHAWHTDGERVSVTAERGYPDDCQFVPEPGALSLAIPGLLVLALISRHRAGRVPVPLT